MSAAVTMMCDTPPSNSEILRVLHEMIDYQLFETQDWPPSVESVPPFFKRMRELGLLVPSELDADELVNNTSVPFDVFLIASFMGIFQLDAILGELRDHGFIDDAEFECVFERRDDPKYPRLVKKRLLKAYFQHFGRTVLH